MEYINPKNNKTLTLSLVNKTLVNKIESLKESMQKLNSDIDKGNGSIRDLIDEVNQTLYEVHWLARTATDREGKILHCANWILSQLQTGFYYDKRKVFMAAEDNKQFYGSPALTVLESCGIIGSRTINGTEAVYIAEEQHNWIINDPDQEGARWTSR